MTAVVAWACDAEIHKRGPYGPWVSGVVKSWDEADHQREHDRRTLCTLKIRPLGFGDDYLEALKRARADILKIRNAVKAHAGHSLQRIDEAMGRGR